MILPPTPEQIAEYEIMQLEKYIKLKVKPKPKWLPRFVWYWLLKNLMYLEEKQRF